MKKAVNKSKNEKIKLLSLISKSMKLSFGDHKWLLAMVIVFSSVGSTIMFLLIPIQAKLFGAISDYKVLDGTFSVLLGFLAIYVTALIADRVANAT
ncbi:MAG: hypothetical protein RR057_05660, partial [Clostridia bacterium]